MRVGVCVYGLAPSCMCVWDGCVCVWGGGGGGGGGGGVTIRVKGTAWSTVGKQQSFYITQLMAEYDDISFLPAVRPLYSRCLIFGLLVS